MTMEKKIESLIRLVLACLIRFVSLYYYGCITRSSGEVRLHLARESFMRVCNAFTKCPSMGCASRIAQPRGGAPRFLQTFIRGAPLMISGEVIVQLSKIVSGNYVM